MNSNTLGYWKEKAKKEIYRWLTDESYSDEIIKNSKIPVGPFTKFLYRFAAECPTAGWGVMVDFNEHSQKIYLVDRYYKWMHNLRDEIQEALEKIESDAQKS